MVHCKTDKPKIAPLFTQCTENNYLLGQRLHSKRLFKTANKYTWAFHDVNHFVLKAPYRACIAMGLGSICSHVLFFYPCFTVLEKICKKSIQTTLEGVSGERAWSFPPGVSCRSWLHQSLSAPLSTPLILTN